MRSPDDILPEIEDALDWYDLKGYKAGPDSLIKVRDGLAIRSYYLAAIAADQKQEYNKAHFIRRIEIGRSKQALISKGSAVNKAEVSSLLENKSAYEAEMEAEAMAYKCDLLLRQVNQVLAAMQQRIAQLKVEKEYTEKQNTT
jgi:hypothetical protein